MTVVRYYVDTNCLSYCLWPRPISRWTDEGLSHLRARVRSAIRIDEIRILGSQYHLEEASRMPAGIRKEWMRFFWDTILWWLLLPTDELVLREVSLGRPLRFNEPFDEIWRRQSIRTICLRSGTEKLDELAKKVEEYVTKLADDSKARRERATGEIEAKYKGKRIHEITTEWWTDAAVRIEDWMGDYMNGSREQLQLPHDRAFWPLPKDLRTAWNIHAYFMARIAMTVGSRRKILDGDVHDAHHYAASCFADVFVTHDAAFRETIRIIPGSLQAIDFEEFALRLGVSPQ